MDPTSNSADEPVAKLGWRLGARVVDTVAFGWLTVVVLIELDQRLLGGDPWGRRAAGIELDSARPIALLALLVILYEIVPTTVAGATPGKAMFGLRVRRSPDDPLPDPVASVVRAVVIYVPVVFLGPVGTLVPVVLLVSVLVLGDRRGLHDRLVGTTVVSVVDDRR